jgi:hypothetical protein
LIGDIFGIVERADGAKRGKPGLIGADRPRNALRKRSSAEKRGELRCA